MIEFRALCRFIAIAATLSVLPATAKELTVTVDGRSAPWSTGANPKLRFGLADARSPKIVIDTAIRPGATITFTAAGSTTTISGGAAFGPIGDTSWPQDRGLALFPSYHIRSKSPVFLNQLVGAFITSDGIVVGKPFAIGAGTKVSIPEGAAAVSLGINDDKFSDNGGALTVRLNISEAQVTVEGGDEK